MECKKIKKILINKVIRNARKYRYYTVEDRPRFSELLDMLPCVKEDVIGNLIEKEIKSNKHLYKRLIELSKQIEPADNLSDFSMFSDKEREVVKELYFGLSSDSRRAMFRVAKHYNLYESIMSEPILYVRELLDMEKLEALDAIQGDKVELASGASVPFDKFYDNIFGKVYLASDSDYYELSDIQSIYRENFITDADGKRKVVNIKKVFDEKRSIKEFSHPVYTEALTLLCIQLNEMRLTNESTTDMESQNFPVKIYSFKKLKKEGNLWLNRPSFQIGQLIFIFGHFGIVESITAGVPTCYLSNGEYIELDYGAYGEFSVAMVEIANANTSSYKIMRERILRLHELQEEERVKTTYRHR